MHPNTRGGPGDISDFPDRFGSQSLLVHMEYSVVILINQGTPHSASLSVIVLIEGHPKSKFVIV
jgi:hypothetical protein